MSELNVWINAGRKALDEILTNYVSTNCEHITDGEWEDMETGSESVIDELIMHLRSLKYKGETK